MGTLAELKARILDECDGVTVRLIGQHITRAIEHYASERFWFSTTSGTATTTASVASVTAPTGLRVDDSAFMTISAGVPYQLERRPLDEVNYELTTNTSTGQPSVYARSDGLVKLHPTPAGAYTLTMFGLYDEAALSSDASSNAWTTEAADLIAARAKKTLYRDVKHDLEKAAVCGTAEEDALYHLRAETVRRGSLGRLRAG
jgi:hypothetical protein